MMRSRFSLLFFLITFICAPLYGGPSDDISGSTDSSTTGVDKYETDGSSQADLQTQIDELKGEVELLKSNIQDNELKKENQKFNIYGFMGTQLSTTIYDKPDSSLVVVSLGKTPLSFMQTHLNLYFQFDPIENWNVLSEVRFLYHPTGEKTGYTPDQSTAEPYMTNRFKFGGIPITDLLETATKNKYEGYFTALPVDKQNEIAIKFGGFTPQYDYNMDGKADLIDTNGDGEPDAVNYMGTGNAIPFGYYPLDAQGLPTSDKTKFVFIKTPVIKSISMQEQLYSTEFFDKSDALISNWGGVGIERSYVEWVPFDAFNVRAGKFFTPFGIWNVDHSVTVLLTPRVPYLLNYIPRTQVGIQVHGTVYLPVVDIKYNLYVSNGQDVAAAVKDYANDKCFGGRLRMNAQSRLFNELSLGVSGYYGRQIQKTEYLKVNYSIFNDGNTVYQSNTANPDLDPFTKTYIDLEESLLGLDMKIDFKGLAIQGEGIYRKNNYKIYSDDYIRTHFYVNSNPKIPIIWAYYVQSSYKLPFSLLGAKFTPYFRYEFMHRQVESISSFLPRPDQGDLEVFSGGLNIRQNPFIVFKLNYTRALWSQYPNENFSVYTGAIAVSF
jgi:hypothetical protein